MVLFNVEDTASVNGLGKLSVSADLGIAHYFVFLRFALSSLLIGNNDR